MRRIAVLMGCLALVQCSKVNLHGSAVLRVLAPGSVEGAALTAVASEWPDSRLEITTRPYSELAEAAEANENYDVVLMDDPWLARLVDKGALLPLLDHPALRTLIQKELDSEDFIENCLDVSKIPHKTGKLYALPFTANSQLLVWNQQLVTNAPTTWEELLEVAQKFKGSLKGFGYALRGDHPNPIVADFLPILWAYGGQILDKNKRPSLDTPEAEKALQLLVHLAKVSPENFGRSDAYTVYTEIAKANAAMGLQWISWAPSLAKSPSGDRLQFANLPAGPLSNAKGQRQKAGVSVMGSWLLGISAASVQRELAAEFITFATSKGQMEISANAGHSPTRESAFKFVHEKWRDASRYAIETARPRDELANWKAVEKVVGDAIWKAVHNARDAGGSNTRDMLQKALKDADTKLGNLELR